MSVLVFQRMWAQQWIMVAQANVIFNSVCWVFSTKKFDKQIAELYKSATCVWSLFMQRCVCTCVPLVLDACRIVGIQHRLLNYICTKTTGLHTRQASRPASQHVSQRPDAVPTSAALLFSCLFFSCFCLLLYFFTTFSLVRERKLRRNLWFFFANTTHAAIIKKIKQTETHWWLIIMSTSKAKQTFC